MSDDSVPGPAEPRPRGRRFFEELWRQGDFWRLESSDFERQKYARQLALLPDRSFRRGLEIGCGAGAFTEGLAERVDQLVAIDVSPAAIQRAHHLRPLRNVEYRVGDVMEFDFGGSRPWDLVVFSETIYYLGWLRTFFEIGWLAHQIHEGMNEEGHLLMANTLDPEGDYLLRPWLIYTYHDLFENVGFVRRREELLQGVKDGVPLRTLVSLFRKRQGTPES